MSKAVSAVDGAALGKIDRAAVDMESGAALDVVHCGKDPVEHSAQHAPPAQQPPTQRVPLA